MNKFFIPFEAIDLIDYKNMSNGGSDKFFKNYLKDEAPEDKALGLLINYSWYSYFREKTKLLALLLLLNRFTWFVNYFSHGYIRNTVCNKQWYSMKLYREVELNWLKKSSVGVNL